MRRIDNLTGIRALAALWVVFYHLDVYMFDVSPWGPFTGFVQHGREGVDVFFILSGFVLSMVYVEKLPGQFNWQWYRRFLGRRFAKIYPLHLLTTLGVIALFNGAAHAHYSFHFSSENNLWSAVCSLLLLHAFGLTHAISWNTPSWSVSAEWFAYTLLFTPLAFGLRRVRTLWLLVCAVALLALMAAVSTPLGTEWTALNTLGILRILPEFFCGYILYRILRGRGRTHGGTFTLLGAGLLAASCYLPYGSLGLMVPAIMVLLTGLYFGSPVTDRTFGNRALVALGDASYSIYLIQTPIQIATRQALLRAHIPLTRPVQYALALAFPAAVSIAGLLTFRWVEEPLRQWLVRYFDGKRRNPENIAPPTAPGLQADTQVSATAG